MSTPTAPPTARRSHPAATNLIEAGGTAVNTTINGGSQYVANGGAAVNATLNSAGQEFVSIGGISQGTMIGPTGKEFVSGAAIGTTINGGTETVESGATDREAPQSTAVPSLSTARPTVRLSMAAKNLSKREVW